MPNTRPSLAELALLTAIAVITGVLVAATVLSITSAAWIAGYGVDYKSFTAGAGTTAALVTWYYLLASYVFPRLRVTEHKQKEPPILRIDHVSLDGNHTRRENNPPATMEQLAQVAEKVFDYGGITSSAGEKIFGGRLPYETFRDWMMTPFKREYFRWDNETNHKGGVKVTEAGYDWLADHYPTPPEAVAYRKEDDQA